MRAKPIFGFVPGMLLACDIGFSGLNHLRFLKREPMLTGILRVAQQPPAIQRCVLAGVVGGQRAPDISCANDTPIREDFPSSAKYVIALTAPVLRNRGRLRGSTGPAPAVWSNYASFKWRLG